ncbi:recombinase family protein [Sphingomonas yabuuchiae]|nr:recombinase family protein [Sphingomonas yabuuchiae]MBN3556747.1 recombinase family protein [Sphingomonas yabuuchiae]
MNEHKTAIGYARVSTEDQKLDLQIQALQQAGCKYIFTDHGQSGTNFKRDGLHEAVRALNPGDTLIVWRLDRLGRSLSGLVALMENLGKRDIHFKSMTENIDTASSGGKLMFHLMAALAEFERSIISERTKAGLAAARTGGRQLGRPRMLSSQQIDEAQHAMKQRDWSLKQMADRFGVSTRTLKRHLDQIVPTLKT